MPAVLSVPVYAIPVFLGLTEGPVTGMVFTQTEIVGTLLSKISASLAVAISVAVVYRAALYLARENVAFWVAVLYAFATSSWSVSSQGLWQSAMSQPLLALALYWFIRGRERRETVVYAGVPLALSVACRPPNVVFAAAFLFHVFRHYRRLVWKFLFFPVVLGALLATYNFYYFGTLAGGYGETVEKFLTYPRAEALLGLLISPSHGLLVHSPFLAFALLGMAVATWRGRDHLLRCTGIASGLLLLLYAGWSSWWHGGFSFSYRFLVDLLPGLTLSLATIWDRVVAQGWRKNLFLALAVYSVFIQLIGAFFYPCGWYETPIKAAVHTERFWDWTDPEFLRCLRAGPVEPDGLRFLREISYR